MFSSFPISKFTHTKNTSAQPLWSHIVDWITVHCFVSARTNFCALTSFMCVNQRTTGKVHIEEKAQTVKPVNLSSSRNSQHA